MIPVHLQQDSGKELLGSAAVGNPQVHVEDWECSSLGVLNVEQLLQRMAAAPPGVMDWVQDGCFVELVLHHPAAAAEDGETQQSAVITLKLLLIVTVPPQPKTTSSSLSSLQDQETPLVLFLSRALSSSLRSRGVFTTPTTTATGWIRAAPPSPRKCRRLVLQPLSIVPLPLSLFPDESHLRRQLHGTVLPWEGRVIPVRGVNGSVLDCLAQPYSDDPSFDLLLKEGGRGCAVVDGTAGLGGEDGRETGTDVVWWYTPATSPSPPVLPSTRPPASLGLCEPTLLSTIESVLRVRALRDPHWVRAAAAQGVPVKASLLLRGPPGSGKTWLTKQLSRWLRLRVFQLDFPTLLRWSEHDPLSTERDLGRTFDLIWGRALRARPSVLILDQIDQFFPVPHRMDECRHSVARRLRRVLRMLDPPSPSSASSSGRSPPVEGVVVIGITQQENPNLWCRRTNSAFRIHLQLRNPTSGQRIGYLKYFLGSVDDSAEESSSLSLDLRRIADHCRGFSAADLRSLCHRITELRQEATGHQALTTEEVLFLVSGMRPFTVSDIGSAVPATEVNWDDVGGLEDAKQALQEAVVWPFRHPEALARMGIPASSGVLMYGPPGTGKTLLAKAAAQESRANFIAVNPSQLLLSGVGQSERAMARLFQEARRSSPCVVFIDEIQAVFGVRPNEAGSSAGVSADVSSALISTFVQQLDQLAITARNTASSPEEEEAEEPVMVTVIGATNIPQAIDPVLLRPGRFGKIVYCGLPNRTARSAILRNLRSKASWQEEVDVEELARRTPGFSGADLAQLVRSAALHATIRDPHAQHLREEDFQAALATAAPSVPRPALRDLKLWGRAQQLRLR